MEAIFEIRETKFSYSDEQIVLGIRELDLHKGELTFIVGASGTGKSTLLEALGLMNDTVHLTNGLRCNVEGTVQLDKLWSQRDDLREQYRLKYFSFIFQSNFLMPTLSAGENVIFTGLLKGLPYEECRRLTYELMSRLDLKASYFDRPVEQLSGGERQRMSFIRGVLASSEVLFADEPTGNLDPNTSRMLMKFMREQVVSRSSSAVVVSHNIGLALEIGDRIIVINKAHDTKAFNEIDILSREGKNWRTDQELCDDPYDYIVSKF